jgi:hypothetical protein
VHDITKWLAAPHFAESPSHAQSLREDGTAQWIFNQGKYCNWKDNDWRTRPGADDAIVGENVLWIYGTCSSNCGVILPYVLTEQGTLGVAKQFWQLLSYRSYSRK